MFHFYSITSEAKNRGSQNGRITVDEYDNKYKEAKLKQEQIKNRINNLQKADEDYYLNSEYILKLASRASELFESSEIEEKRLFLKLTLQNLELKGKKVQFSWQKPFDQIAKYADRPTWLPNPKDIINQALGTIVAAFEDVGQMELIKVRWEQINKLQLTS